MLPAIIVAVSALSAGAVAGRKYLKGEVKKAKRNAIADASEIVRQRINDEADKYVRNSLRLYLRNMAIKIGLLGLVLGAFWLGWLSGLQAGLIMTALFAVFLVYDTVQSWPSARLIFSELRRNGWQPRLALAEIVAAQVFDQVLTEAKARETSLWSDISMRLAGERPDLVSQEIAVEVAEIARRTSWHDLKPFLISGGVKFGGLVALYSMTVFAMVRALG
jgi:hypothetical protein